VPEKGLTLPAPAYLPNPPQYIPPESTFPFPVPKAPAPLSPKDVP
jgi:hypothetical protein